MRSSLVVLQLFLACVLVCETSVAEENKECCGPGVPPEKSCCPKANSTSQEPEKKEEKPVVQAKPSSKKLAKPKRRVWIPEEPNSEEMEERGKEYRKRMQRYGGSRYEAMFLKQQALDYFNKRQADAFYRPIEDTNISIQRATGTILIFSQYLVNTNCTKEEGRRHSTEWYALPSTKTVPCVLLPKEQQKKLKCKVYVFLDSRTGRSAVLHQNCEPVVFWEGTEDTFDLNELLDFSPVRFEPPY